MPIHCTAGTYAGRCSLSTISESPNLKRILRVDFRSPPIAERLDPEVRTPFQGLTSCSPPDCGAFGRQPTSFPFFGVMKRRSGADAKLIENLDYWNMKVSQGPIAVRFAFTVPPPPPSAVMYHP